MLKHNRMASGAGPEPSSALPSSSSCPAWWAAPTLTHLLSARKGQNQTNRGKISTAIHFKCRTVFPKAACGLGSNCFQVLRLRCLERYFHLSWTFTAPLEISRRGGCSTSLQSTAVLLQGKNVKSETFKIRRSNCYPILGTMPNKQCLGNKKERVN